MWRDAAHLLDMLNAARRVLMYTMDVTENEFEGNNLPQDATIRQLGIIGEAARKVSQETRDRHPEISWHEIIGIRNRLIHEYFRVDVQKVWQAAQIDVPPPEDE